MKHPRCYLHRCHSATLRSLAWRVPGSAAWLLLGACQVIDLRLRVQPRKCLWFEVALALVSPNKFAATWEDSKGLKRKKKKHLVSVFRFLITSVKSQNLSQTWRFDGSAGCSPQLWPIANALLATQVFLLARLWTSHTHTHTHVAAGQWDACRLQSISHIHVEFGCGWNFISTEKSLFLLF